MREVSELNGRWYFIYEGRLKVHGLAAVRGCYAVMPPSA
jgi:hypothetical protein